MKQRFNKQKKKKEQKKKVISQLRQKSNSSKTNIFILIHLEIYSAVNCGSVCFFVCLFVFCCFSGKVLLNSPTWSESHYVDQTEYELVAIPLLLPPYYSISLMFCAYGYIFLNIISTKFLFFYLIQLSEQFSLFSDLRGDCSFIFRLLRPE